MPFDALNTAAVRQELHRKIVGGRVQNIVMPGPLTISLEVYRSGTGRTHLLLSAHPQHARVQLTGANPSRDPSQHPPLLLLLRKYVRGGTILDVSQPTHERVLEVSIAKRFWPDKHQEYHSEGDFRDSETEAEEEEDAPIVTVTLVAEVMGRLSNIVLVAEDGTVLDSVKRVPPSINRYRTTLPNHRYVAPPPQDKRDPSRASVNTLALELSRIEEGQPEAPAWQGLVSGFLGISPALAKEIVFRTFGDVNMPARAISREPARLASLLQGVGTMLALEQTEDWNPCVAWRQSSEGTRKPADFAPYLLSHLEQVGAELGRYSSISEAMDAYFASVESLAGHSALKAQVRQEIEELYGRAERRVRALREELKRSQALDELRRKGEFILSYMHTLEPSQNMLVIPEENLSIELDPALTPVENAQAYFKEYRKARSAHEGLPARIAEAQMQVGYMEELLTSLDLASSYDDIKAVRAEVQQMRARPHQGQEPAKPPGGKGPKQQGKEKAPQPLRLKTRSGATLLVGRTATQNDAATFRLAAPDDLWFHARNVPGAHVILRAPAGLAPGDVEEAASLAAAYSKARTDAQVDVVYTERKFVRKVPNSPPGFVTYKNERVIRVAPRVAPP